MADTRSTDLEDTRDPIWEMIPWYVNGSLPDADVQAVEQRRATSPEFDAEIERQQAIAAGICMLDPMEGAEKRSWRTLSAQIKAEERARQGAFSAMWLPDFRISLAVAGTVSAALLVAVVAISPAPETGDFDLLTDPPSGQVVKFQAAPDVERAEIIRLLEAQGFSLVAGPSETGVYEARLPEDTDPQAAADALNAMPEFLLALPR